MLSARRRDVCQKNNGNIQLAADMCHQLHVVLETLQSHARQLVACCNAQVAGHESCPCTVRDVFGGTPHDPTVLAQDHSPEFASTAAGDDIGPKTPRSNPKIGLQ